MAELGASRKYGGEQAVDADELERARHDRQTATYMAAELRETNAGLAAELQECREREAELLGLHEMTEMEREADLLELQERTSRERVRVEGCRTRGGGGPGCRMKLSRTN